jgi:hypothetical protein
VATKNSPSYAVEILGQEYSGRVTVITLYAVKLPREVREWWHSRKVQEMQPLPPIAKTTLI